MCPRQQTNASNHSPTSSTASTPRQRRRWRGRRDRWYGRKQGNGGTPWLSGPVRSQILSRRPSAAFFCLQRTTTPRVPADVSQAGARLLCYIIRVIVAAPGRGCACANRRGVDPPRKYCPERQYLPIYGRWRVGTPSSASKCSPASSAQRPCHRPPASLRQASYSTAAGASQPSRTRARTTRTSE